MGSIAHKLAVVQHQDMVGTLHAGRTLGDDEHRHTARFLFNSLAQRRVSSKIQRRGTVIENQNLRLWHQCAGNRQSLALPA